MSAADHETALLSALAVLGFVEEGRWEKTLAEGVAALDALVGLLRQTEKERENYKQQYVEMLNATADRPEQEVERLKRGNQERETFRYDSSGKCLDCGGMGGCHSLSCRVVPVRETANAVVVDEGEA